MQQKSIRDRLLDVYRHCPESSHVAASYVRYLPRGGGERDLRNRGLGLIDFYPAVSLLAPAWHTHEGYISEVRDAVFHIEHFTEGGMPTEKRSYHTPLGTVSQITQKDPQYHSDWTRRHYITETEDYRVVQYLVEKTVFQNHHDAIRSRLCDLGEDGVLLARLDRSPFQKILVELSKPDQFLMDMLIRTPEALSLLEALRERLLEQVELACSSPAALIWQPDNLSGDMTPPDLFEEFVLSFYEEAAARVHRAGKVYVVHMDGRLKSLCDMIAGSSIPVIESFSLPDMGGDMTLEEAYAAWPSKVILPNFPSSWCAKEEDEIRGQLAATIKAIPQGRGAVIQISEDLPPRQWYRVGKLLTEVVEKSS